MANQHKNSAHPKWFIPAAVILFLILIGIAIPNVRASVSSWLGLSVAPSSETTAVPVTLEAIVSSTPAQLAAASDASQTATPAVATQTIPLPLIQTSDTEGTAVDINQLSSQVGWNVLAPINLPAGYHFQSVYFDVNQKMLVLTYLVTRPLPGTTDPSLTSSETITLLEALSNSFVPMQIAPNTSVTDIQVNGEAAAYTVGGWDTEFVKDNQSAGGGKMVSSWRNDLPVKNLYWQVGKLYLTLVTADEAVTQQELMDMAASITK